jgi:hypothetical protein
MEMSPMVVSTPAGLMAALKKADTEAVILLSQGPWPTFDISGVTPPGTVTIRSQDANHPAILSALTISGSENLSFQDVKFLSSIAVLENSNYAPSPFKILNCKNISLNHVSVQGRAGGEAKSSSNGLLISRSSHIQITHSQFHQLYNGILEDHNTDIVIVENEFYDIRVDGIDNAGSSYVTISSNQFSDFHPQIKGTAGDHPDAIQFWTQGTTEVAHDINISDNIINRGHGYPIQGVFVTDQVRLPYKHLTIAHNTITGTMYNGIMVSGCEDSKVLGNIVQPYNDITSWIRVQYCNAVTVTENQAASFPFKGNISLVESKNKPIGPIAQRDVGQISEPK